MNTHGVWRVCADVDTDQLAPGAYMKLGIDDIARHCLEALRPDFAGSVRRGDVLVAGPNFGIGSSREQAAAVLVTLGVAAVIAPSFGGFDARAGRIVCTSGALLACKPIPDFLLDMVEAGGLFNLLKKRYPKEPASA